MPVSAAAIEGGIGIYKTVAGIVHSGQAKKDAAALQASRPKYSINPEAGNNLSLAESELSNGMSADAEKAYKDISTGQLSDSLGALLKGGGSVNSVGALYGSAKTGQQQLSILKDQTRAAQVQSYMTAGQYMSDQRDKAFLYNVDAPWKDRGQAVGDERKAAANEIDTGINTVGSAGINYAGMKNEDNTYNKYFGSSTAATTVPSPAPASSPSSSSGQATTSIDNNTAIQKLPSDGVWNFRAY